MRRLITILTSGTPTRILADLSAGHFFAAADISLADLAAAVDTSAADFVAAVDTSAADFVAVAEDTPVAAMVATGRGELNRRNEG
jgi:hypothetical protein